MSPLVATMFIHYTFNLTKFTDATNGTHEKVCLKSVEKMKCLQRKPEGLRSWRGLFKSMLASEVVWDTLYKLYYPDRCTDNGEVFFPKQIIKKG